MPLCGNGPGVREDLTTYTYTRTCDLCSRKARNSLHAGGVDSLQGTTKRSRPSQAQAPCRAREPVPGADRWDCHWPNRPRSLPVRPHAAPLRRSKGAFRVRPRRLNRSGCRPQAPGGRPACCCWPSYRYRSSDRNRGRAYRGVIKPPANGMALKPSPCSRSMTPVKTITAPTSIRKV